jgi:cytidine deaminase
MDNDALIAEARKHLGTFALSQPDWVAGEVAAAVLTASGKVYTGISIDLACGIGFCAEHSAVAAMLQGRETNIRKVVAVSRAGVIPPCGRCRELMAQVDHRNFECEVILAKGTRTLSKLLPDHWAYP